MSELALKTETDVAVVTDMAGGLLEVIARAARDPNVDIDKMERLLEMQERVHARNAKAAYYSALAEMQPSLPAIVERGGIKDRNGNVVGPWAQWPERMSEKSELHRLRKRIPIIGHEDVVARLQDDEVADVDQGDDAGDSVVIQAAAEAPRAAAPPKSRPKGLQAALDAAQDQREPQ